MSTATTQTQEYTTLELLTLSGPEYRRVSTAPPRKPTPEEIPVIDLREINGDAGARKSLAAKVRAAAEKTGFFYISNHGIPEAVIQSALGHLQQFFAQPLHKKEKISNKKTGLGIGYNGVGSTHLNRSESRDQKETFSMRYDSRNDLHGREPVQKPEDRSREFADHDFIWEETSDISGFKEVCVDFWQRRLHLARKLVRIFALALDLSEDYFDAITTHPGADAVFIHYPGTAEAEAGATVDAGIGSHTDIQCFTLLWQDMSGGLQVLSGTDEWLDASPIEGTLVVNIGDFLQRLSNNKFRSTVHRVYNRSAKSRFSMPFFLGFNPEAICEVVPSCFDESNPARYEPISCGKWHRDRIALAQSSSATPEQK